MDACADIYIAREDLPADPEGELCLIASAHRARVARPLCGGIADRDCPYEGRRGFLFGGRTATERGQGGDNDERGVEMLLHERSPLLCLSPVFRF